MVAPNQPARNTTWNRWKGGVSGGLGAGLAILLHRIWPGVWLVIECVLASAVVLGLLYFIVLEPRLHARRAPAAPTTNDGDADL
jgi:predicted lipid-binding transport protein (Tim44 family)